MVYDNTMDDDQKYHEPQLAANFNLEDFLDRMREFLVIRKTAKALQEEIDQDFHTLFTGGGGDLGSIMAKMKSFKALSSQMANILPELYGPVLDDEETPHASQ